MKLLSKPAIVRISHHRQASLGLAINVKIAVPDEPITSEEKVWQKLKYSNVIKFELSKKIDRLVISKGKEDMILYGVLPVALVTTTQEGRIFECYVDQYTIIPSC